MPTNQNLVSASLSIGTQNRQFFYRKQSSDEVVIKQIFNNREYDFRRLRRSRELEDFLGRHKAHNLKPLIVDAGANIGASPIYFLSIVPDALVVAVEPDFGNFELLSKNVEGLSVVATRAAISSTPGWARAFDVGEGFWGYRTQRIDSCMVPGSVPSVTVNAIYEQHSSGLYPFLVKVDIEGAEMELFSSNTEWVSRTPLIIIELHDWLLPKSGCSRPFLRCISDLDRDFVSIGENIFSIANDLHPLALVAQ
jgi:FkbM family methyltransferase